LAVIAAATATPFNENVLHMRLWAVIVASVLVLMGILPRVKKHKLGF
jgi:ABC-type Mn2+/Zn2+ transport system permease subunit